MRKQDSEPCQAGELYGADLSSVLPHERFQKVDFSLDRLPFNRHLFDSVSAYDALDYAPRVTCVSDPLAPSGMRTQNCFIHLINQIWRV
jgi:hypothetical protein